MVRLRVCTVFTFLIISILLPYNSASAFNRHRLSFSVGGDWTKCQALRRQWSSPEYPPYLPELGDQSNYGWRSRSDFGKEQLSGSLGYSGKISYALSKKISTELVGFYARQWGLHYPNSTISRSLDDYGNIISRSYYEYPNSSITGGGVGVSYYSKNHNINFIMSATILLCKAYGSIDSLRTIPYTDQVNLTNLKYYGWGWGTEISYGVLINVTSHYAFNPVLGFRYIGTGSLKEKVSNAQFRYSPDYTGFRLGFNLKYSL